MYIVTYELTIPGINDEIERRAARARHGTPARPARRSLVRWLRSRLATAG